MVRGPFHGRHGKKDAYFREKYFIDIVIGFSVISGLKLYFNSNC
jgi:hypothetical protein